MKSIFMEVLDQHNVRSKYCRQYFNKCSEYFFKMLPKYLLCAVIARFTSRTCSDK